LSFLSLTTLSKSNPLWTIILRISFISLFYWVLFNTNGCEIAFGGFPVGDFYTFYSSSTNEFKTLWISLFGFGPTAEC